MTDTLRSIYEQCSRLAAPQLDFIPAELTRHREIVDRDLKELAAAASNELDRSAVFLAGSLLESILFSFLKGQETYISAIRGGPFVFDPLMSLQNYKEIFNRYFGRAMPGSQLPDSIIDYRDTIHINRELELPSGTFIRASREILPILDKLVGDIGNFAAVTER